jgi:hypothetical protein
MGTVTFILYLRTFPLDISIFVNWYKIFKTTVYYVRVSLKPSQGRKYFSYWRKTFPRALNPGGILKVATYVQHHGVRHLQQF